MIDRRSGTNTTYSYHDKIGRKIRMQRSSIIMEAPIKNLIEKLKKNNIIQYIDNKVIPKAILHLTVLPIKDIIHRYRSILSGILNFYSFVDNRPYLKKIYDILKMSLKKTIRNKECINNKLFLSKYGRDINISILKYDGSFANLNFACPALNKQTMNFLYTEIKDPLSAKNWKISGISPLDQPCGPPDKPTPSLLR